MPEAALTPAWDQLIAQRDTDFEELFSELRKALSSGDVGSLLVGFCEGREQARVATLTSPYAIAERSYLPGDTDYHKLGRLLGAFIETEREEIA